MNERSAETVDPMGHNAGFEDPYQVVGMLKAQVEAEMIVTRDYQRPMPIDLAGSYPGTQDLNRGLKCASVVGRKTPRCLQRSISNVCR